MQWQCRGRNLSLSRALVMGILNVTPDSFSDGGRYVLRDAARARAETMWAEGAAIIDVGGESTRPGALPVSAEEEIGRVVPVIEAIAQACDVAISIDTSKPEVMSAAVAAGACIINDVHALRLPGARECAALLGAGVVLMHMKGEPRTMQDQPLYGDVAGEVSAFLLAQREACLAAGIAPAAIAFDPGIGFGKGVEHNLELLRRLALFAALPAPLIVGVSRKSFIGKILQREMPQRLHGGLGLAAFAVAQGARVVRTHDVRATADAIGMVNAVLQGAVN